MEEANQFTEKRTSENYYLTDNQMVDKIRNGEPAFLGLLYNKYYRIVFQKCMHFTKEKNEAHDLTQDIFLKTFDHLSSFQGRAKFSTWLYSISYNHCIEYLRKRNRHKFVELEKAFHIPEVNDYNDNNETYLTCLEQIFNGLNHLSDLEKEMLIMKYQEDHSIKELQEKYHLSESAAKMRLKRAKNKVLQLLGSQY